MTITPLGKITVAAAGTPVHVTSVSTPCEGIIVSPLPGNTGNTYLGIAGMVKATSVGVIKAFVKPAASGTIDPLQLTSPEGNQLNAVDFWVDADVNGEGLLFSYLQE